MARRGTFGALALLFLGSACEPTGPQMRVVNRPESPLRQVAANDEGTIAGVLDSMIYGFLPDGGLGGEPSAVIVVYADGRQTRADEADNAFTSVAWPLPGSGALCEAAFAPDNQWGVARVNDASFTRDTLLTSDARGTLAVSRDGVAMIAYESDLQDSAYQYLGRTTLWLDRNTGTGWTHWASTDVDADNASIYGFSAGSADDAWLYLSFTNPKTVPDKAIVHVGADGFGPFLPFPDCGAGSPALGCDYPGLLALGDSAFTWTAAAITLVSADGTTKHILEKEIARVAGASPADLWAAIWVKGARSCGQTQLTPYGGHVTTCQNDKEVRVGHYDGKGWSWYLPPTGGITWLVSLGSGKARVEGWDADPKALVWADAP